MENYEWKKIPTKGNLWKYAENRTFVDSISCSSGAFRNKIEVRGWKHDKKAFYSMEYLFLYFLSKQRQFDETWQSTQFKKRWFYPRTSFPTSLTWDCSLKKAQIFLYSTKHKNIVSIFVRTWNISAINNDCIQRFEWRDLNLWYISNKWLHQRQMSNYVVLWTLLMAAGNCGAFKCAFKHTYAKKTSSKHLEIVIIFRLKQFE